MPGLDLAIVESHPEPVPLVGLRLSSSWMLSPLPRVPISVTVECRNIVSAQKTSSDSLSIDVHVPEAGSSCLFGSCSPPSGHGIGAGEPPGPPSRRSPLVVGCPRLLAPRFATREIFHDSPDFRNRSVVDRADIYNPSPHRPVALISLAEGFSLATTATSRLTRSGSIQRTILPTRQSGPPGGGPRPL